MNTAGDLQESTRRSSGGSRVLLKALRVENQQQTQPTCDAGSGNQTWDTLMGGDCSHHCAIPALLSLL